MCAVTVLLQGGVTRAKRGVKTEAAPKYVKIPQVRAEKIPETVGTLRVELVVLRYLDRAQAKDVMLQPHAHVQTVRSLCVSRSNTWSSDSR